MLVSKRLKLLDDNISSDKYSHTNDIALDNVEVPENMQIPEIHTCHFNVTNTCNLKCSMCYINAVQAPTSQLPLDLVRQLARDFVKLGGKRVILSGGEPLVRKDWYELFKIWANYGVALSVVSNGTQIPHPNIIEQIKSLMNNQYSGFLISLDGNESNHEMIRGIKGSYKKTIDACKMLRKAEVAVQVNCTITKANYSDIAFLTKLSRDLDLTLRLSILNPYNGRGMAVEKEALGLEEMMAVIKYCHEIRKQGSKVFVNLPPLLLPTEDIIPIRSPSCGWTHSYCGVLHNGDVTICGVAGDTPELVAGNLYYHSFADLWINSDLFKRLRSLRAQDLKGVCGRCPFQAQCGGACRLSAHKRWGDMLGPYPVCQAFYEAGLIPEEILTATQ